MDSDVPVPQDDTIRGASLPARIYGNKHAHRLLPAPVAMELVARVGPWARQKRNPAERRDAEQFMQDLLRHTPRLPEAPRLARQWLAEKSRMGELFWRPWLIRHSAAAGREHWDAARAEGRGVVVVFGHILGAWSVPALLGANNLPAYVVIGPHYWAPMPPGYEGLALLHRRTEYGDRALGPERLVSSEGRPERLGELLAAGEAVTIAFDAPGRAAVPFLGRTVLLGGGAARLAWETKAPVLPAVPERHGSKLTMRFHAPLDPRDYADNRALRTAIARRFEPIVLERPQDVELAWYPSPLIIEAPERGAAAA